METDTGTPTEQRQFRVKQKIISLRPVYEIYEEATDKKVAIGRQTWMSFLRSTINIEDPNENRLLTAKSGFFKKKFELIEPSGEVVGAIERPWFSFGKKFKILYRDEVIKADGGILGWGFEGYSSLGHFALKLDKKVISVRDEFRVTVGEYMDWLHGVTAAIVVDMMFFQDNR
ncbi:MAG: hypothetical protein R6V83_13390 [Candidatus Thorarchaeota archaeon]